MKLTECVAPLQDAFPEIEKQFTKPEDCNAQKLEKIMVLYKSNRLQEYSVAMTNFNNEYAADETNAREAFAGVATMELEIPISRTFLLNYQLMFKEDTFIKAITPVAREALLRFWKKPFWEYFDDTIRFIIRNENGDFTNDVRGRAAERYFLHCVEKNEAVATQPEGD